MLSSILFHAAALLPFLSTPSIAAPLSKRSIVGPVIQANFPDPSIIQVGSTYYAFATNNGAQHIPWASSPDFNSWTVAAGQDALPTVGAWSNGNNVWAPDVIQLRQNSSRFVMYYTANTADGVTHCLGAAVSSNVEGPYSPLPDTLGDCPRSQGGAIDPAGFIDSDGNIYVVYKIDGNSVGHGGNCNNGNDPIVPTPIMIQPMEADGVTPRGGPTQILDRSDADGPLVEAPSLVRSSEGVYVLFFSSNCFDGPYYDTSYATASNVMGPYTKTQKPLLVPGSGNNLYSPGGTDVLSDGTKIVFHADQGTSANTRQMYIGEISISGQYTPPPCTFNRATINFTVTSAGRQFDRLGLMFLGDIEVFRTSTAEPTVNGIVWTYVKEMDQYDALWKTKQKIIFDLGNLIDDTYTAAFNTTLTATFFTVPDTQPAADSILPISARLSSVNMPSAFQVPSQNASVSYQLPRNVERAVVSLSACGQSAEEFWYTNVFSSEENTFTNTTGTLYAYSPFREVQLLIDGQLAGVSWPFPIIFTGGIVPGLWRPVVGIDTFDLREHEVDITPWLPLLCDGTFHDFEIRVVGLDDDGAGHASLSQTVGSYWVVTGKIFLYLDKAGSGTTGNAPSINTPPPEIAITSSVTQNSTGANETLTYMTRVSRTLAITSLITTSTGSQHVTWSQTLAYTNYNAFTAQGLTQFTSQNTTGTDGSASGYERTFAYPLTVNSTFTLPNPVTSAFSISASLSRGLDLSISGPSVFPSSLQSFTPNTTFASNTRTPDIYRPDSPHGLPAFNTSLIHTTQTGSAKYLSSPPSSSSFGTTEQDFIFSGISLLPAGSDTVELYHRHVLAVNGSIREDDEFLFGRTMLSTNGHMQAPDARQDGEDTVFSIRSLLGRGPGKPGAEATLN